LAKALDAQGLPIFSGADGFTKSHQFAVEAKGFGGGQAASKQLRQAGFLACGIGLPIAAVEGDMNGLRIGTPELVRWGMTSADADRMAGLIKRGLKGEAIADEVAEWRTQFSDLHFMH
jgi:glycine hydroxymethyltransferase